MRVAVLAGSRLLGTLPLDTLPKTGDHIVFAARRWQVTYVDPDREEISVEPAKRRKRPSFVSAGGMIHHRVGDQMMRLLASTSDVSYLDAQARDALAAARSDAKDHQLARRRLIPISPTSTLWLTWTGTVETSCYEAMLASVGVESRNEIIGLVCKCSTSDLRTIIQRWSLSAPELLTLAEHIRPKHRRKYDNFLDDALLDEGIASQLRWMTPTPFP